MGAEGVGGAVMGSEGVGVWEVYIYLIFIGKAAMSSDHAEQGGLSYCFYALLKVIRHFVPTNQKKRERENFIGVNWNGT
jgi:hypothetical protein